MVVAAALGAMLLSSNREAGGTPPRQALRVTAGRLTLRAVRAGAGRPVVLLHGFGESLISWRGAFDRLAAHSDVVALDLPGFGLSDKPASGYSNDTLAAVVLDAMTSLGMAHATLVGHSMGGAIAVATALRAPERVDALVLVDPAVSAGTWGFKPPRDAASTTDWLRRAIARYETLRPRFTAPHDPSWLAEDSTALAYSPSNDSAYGRAIQAVLREFDFDYLTPARASRLHLPVLLLWGEFDQVVPPQVGRTLLLGLPQATLEVVPRSLHRPHVERPDTVAAMIESFLDRPRPR